MQLVQLQRDLREFQEAGIQAIGISFDPPNVLADFAAKNGIQYPLLSDPDSKAIEAYGLLAPSGKGVARPEAFLLNSKGVIGTKLTLEWYVGRPLTDALLEAGLTEP
jgi:peroxiredoxin Q/BCP